NQRMTDARRHPQPRRAPEEAEDDHGRRDPAPRRGGHRPGRRRRKVRGRESGPGPEGPLSRRLRRRGGKLMAVLAMRDALNQALREEMKRDESVFLLGETSASTTDPSK